jgi:acetyl-CoA acetyltransferase
MMAGIDGVAVAGIGRTAFTRASGRTTGALAAEAVRAAIADAGLSPATVDGMACYQAGDSTPTVEVARAVGCDDLHWSLDRFGGGNVVVSCVADAARAIATGACSTAVVYRSMNGRSGRRFGTAAGGEGFAVGGESQFGGPVGYLVPPQWMAMWAARHQFEHGSTCEDLGAIAVTQRAHAVANPVAIARTPLAIEDYLAGRWVVEPLRIFDCAYEVDGAVALVLTSLDRARDLPNPPVRIAHAVDSTSGGGSWDQWPDPTTMFSARLARRLWDGAGIRPADIDVACIYDCFTYTVMAVVEDLGFVEKGGVGDWFRAGRATYGGDVVVNPHGGLLSEGYIHGLNHHLEAVQQLRGGAGPRQVEGSRHALVTAGAGPYGGAMIYRGGDG